MTNYNDLSNDELNVKIASVIFNYVVTLSDDEYMLKSKTGDYSKIPDYAGSIEKCDELIKHLKSKNIELYVNLNLNNSTRTWQISMKNKKKNLTLELDEKLPRVVAIAALTFFENDDKNEPEEKNTDILKLNFS